MWGTTVTDTITPSIAKKTGDLSTAGNDKVCDKVCSNRRG